MNLFKDKKLLILGGAFQHCKLVEAAHELGIKTYVTDYLELKDSPAKQMASVPLMYNITEIDKIVEFCKEEDIDGIISTSLDPCQKPYQKLCERLNLPCFGNKEQFDILTDKNLFKRYCIEYGVDVITKYQEQDFLEKESCLKKVEFPILVKPGESRGSRGQTICDKFEEVNPAIVFAKKESSNGEVLIEKYMGQSNDFSMTILMINGKAYPIRTVDRYLGKYEDKLDKLAVGSASPSVFTDLYMEKVHDKVERFYQKLGLINAPVFMQGFVDGDHIRFYDPALRLPGGEYERMFTKATGKNPLYPLIEFALTGEIKNFANEFTKNDIYINGKVVGQVLPALKEGEIAKVEGLEEIKKRSEVLSVFTRFNVGDKILPTANVNQRFAEIVLVCEGNKQMKQVVDFIYKTLKVLDTKGQDMVVSKYNTEVFVERAKLTKERS